MENETVVATAARTAAIVTGIVIAIATAALATRTPVATPTAAAIVTRTDPANTGASAKPRRPSEKTPVSRTAIATRSAKPSGRGNANAIVSVRRKPRARRQRLRPVLPRPQ